MLDSIDIPKEKESRVRMQNVRGILLHMTIPNGLSGEVTSELRIELSTEQAMKMSSRIVFQKKRSAKTLKVLHAFSSSSWD